MNLKLRCITLVLFIAILGTAASHAQILVTGGGDKNLAEDSVKRDFSNQPYFGLYKDNYFIFGPTIGPKPTNENTNVKFQISISQRLTRSTLPWGTYLYLFYTQKCFWNVLERSLPMTDLNFNPGLGLTKPFFVKDRYIGKLTFLIEHESNGRDSIESRSWNRVALSANVFVTKNLMVHGKIWVPIVDGENNRDIVDYCGFWQWGVQALSDNRRFSAGITLVKRKGWNMNWNTIIDISYRIFKRDNQFLFLQYYNGYGEGLLEYNKFHSQLRVGILIKPKLFSDF
ncbi:MAG: phospholipase A [Muribaculaceae bacterium]|nr:phospholipase A [Muribaculaceae bacterium]MDE6134466.1 phospholipase A [Muribaculaceae bacterium]